MGGRMENDEIINFDENSLLGWISNKYHPMNNAILSKAVLHLEHSLDAPIRVERSLQMVLPSLWDFVEME